MAREEHVAVEKGKGKEKELPEDLTTEVPSSTPPATTTTAASDTENDASEVIPAPTSPPSKDTADSPAPPPPPPAKDAEKVAPQLPQRPLLQFDPPLPQPLPPPHPHANRHIFPTSYYAARAMEGQMDTQLQGGPDKVQFSRSWTITKLFLSTLSLVLSVVIVALGVVIASWGGLFSAEESIFALTTSTAGLAILWTAIDSFVTCVTRERQRVPPGAHVGLHLVIWLMGAISVAMVSLLVVYPTGGYRSRSGTYYSGTYFSSYYQIKHIESALLGLMVILMIIHFFLFVRACVETHRVNTASRMFKNSIIRYVTVPVQPDGTTGGVVFPGMPPGWYAQPMPGYPAIPPEAAFPARRSMQQQPQANGGPAMPPQAVLYGGYYAPAAPAGMQQIDSSLYGQPSAAAALHGYYGPPPAAVAPEKTRRQSSGGSARHHSQRVSSGPGARRASRQNPPPPTAAPPSPPVPAAEST
ncbi:hypothetical protein V8F20_007338 [Naviculisporaceae sp. PSN 640]